MIRWIKKKSKKIVYSIDTLRIIFRSMKKIRRLLLEFVM